MERFPTKHSFVAVLWIYFFPFIYKGEKRHSVFSFFLLLTARHLRLYKHRSFRQSLNIFTPRQLDSVPKLVKEFDRFLPKPEKQQLFFDATHLCNFSEEFVKLVTAC